MLPLAPHQPEAGRVGEHAANIEIEQRHHPKNSKNNKQKNMHGRDGTDQCMEFQAVRDLGFASQNIF